MAGVPDDVAHDVHVIDVMRDLHRYFKTVFQKNAIHAWQYNLRQIVHCHIVTCSMFNVPALVTNHGCKPRVDDRGEYASPHLPFTTCSGRY